MPRNAADLSSHEDEGLRVLRTPAKGSSTPPSWLGNGSRVSDVRESGLQRYGTEYVGRSLLSLWDIEPGKRRTSRASQPPSSPSHRRSGDPTEQVPQAFRDSTSLAPEERDKRRQLRSAFRLGQHVTGQPAVHPSSVATPATAATEDPAVSGAPGSQRWRFAPPQDTANRLSSLVRPPAAIPSSKAAPLVEGEGVGAANILMFVSKRPPSSRLVHIYNGVSNRVLALRVAHKGLYPEGDARQAAEILVLEVLPGETKPFYSCGADAVQRPAWVLNSLPPSVAAAKTASMKQQARRELDEVTGGLLGELQSDRPEEAVIRSCALRGTPFVDLWFPPKAGATGADAAWGRPDAFLCEPASRLGSLALPNNLERGPAGDATLLCVLAVLSEYPSPHSPYVDFVKQLFASHTEAHAKGGCVKVQLVVDGWWRDIAVDSLLPLAPIPTHTVFLPTGVRPITRMSDLWPCYVEKAYAKELGGYKALAQQAPHVMLADLTGFPCEPLRWKARHTAEGASLFADMAEWHARGFVLTLRTPHRAKRYGEAGRDVDERYEQAGLLAGHTYYVLQTIRAGNLRFLHIRNPWARGTEWRGDYAWNSSLWTPQLRAACNVDGDVSGTFMVTWEEAQTWFGGGNVTYCVANSGEVRLSLPLDPAPAFVVEVNTEAATRIYVGVSKVKQDGSAADIIVALLEPSEGYGYVYREEVAEPSSRCFLTVYELEACSAPSFICVRCGGGVSASELVVSIMYTPLETERSRGSFVLREALPFYSAITLAAQSGSALVDLSRVRAGVVSTWVQSRRDRSMPAPWQSSQVTHVPM